MTDMSRLGMVVGICFHCQMVYHTETVNDKKPYVAIARLRKITLGPNLKTTLAVYEDLLGLLEPILQWLISTTPCNISEACKHKLSSLYVYLSRLRGTIQVFRNNLKKSNP